ncbi:MAG: DUF2779 domain-containing protein, partial [Polyangia bacterium]
MLPVWWRASRSSASRIATRAPRRASAIPVVAPTMPPPISATSKTVSSPAPPAAGSLATVDLRRRRARRGDAVDHVGHRPRGLDAPLHFLDFETVAPVVPLFDGTSPCRQVPFQYSLHRQTSGGELAHRAFLGDGRSDPRPALVDQLLREVGPDGDILSYTAYEKTQLNNLIEAVPARAVELRAV